MSERRKSERSRYAEWPHMTTLYNSTNRSDESGNCSNKPKSSNNEVFESSNPYGFFRCHTGQREEFVLDSFPSNGINVTPHSHKQDDENLNSWIHYYLGDKFYRGSTCRVVLCIFLVFILIAVVIAGVVLAVLLSQRISPRTGTKYFQSVATINNATFKEALKDVNSPEFQQLATQFCEALKAIYSSNLSPIQHDYEDCEVLEFRPGSVVAVFKIGAKQYSQGIVNGRLHELLTQLKVHLQNTIAKKGSWESLRIDETTVQNFVEVDPHLSAEHIKSSRPKQHPIDDENKINSSILPEIQYHTTFVTDSNFSLTTSSSVTERVSTPLSDHVYSQMSIYRNTEDLILSEKEGMILDETLFDQLDIIQSQSVLVESALESEINPSLSLISHTASPPTSLSVEITSNTDKTDLIVSKHLFVGSVIGRKQVSSSSDNQSQDVLIPTPTLDPIYKSKIFVTSSFTKQIFADTPHIQLPFSSAITDEQKSISILSDTLISDIEVVTTEPSTFLQTTIPVKEIVISSSMVSFLNTVDTSITDAKHLATNLRDRKVSTPLHGSEIYSNMDDRVKMYTSMAESQIDAHTLTFSKINRSFNESDAVLIYTSNYLTTSDTLTIYSKPESSFIYITKPTRLMSHEMNLTTALTDQIIHEIDSTALFSSDFEERYLVTSQKSISSTPSKLEHIANITYSQTPPVGTYHQTYIKYETDEKSDITELSALSLPPLKNKTVIVETDALNNIVLKASISPIFRSVSEERLGPIDSFKEFSSSFVPLGVRDSTLGFSYKSENDHLSMDAFATTETKIYQTSVNFETQVDNKFEWFLSSSAPTALVDEESILQRSFSELFTSTPSSLAILDLLKSVASTLSVSSLIEHNIDLSNTDIFSAKRSNESFDIENVLQSSYTQKFMVPSSYSDFVFLSATPSNMSEKRSLSVDQDYISSNVRHLQIATDVARRTAIELSTIPKHIMLLPIHTSTSDINNATNNFEAKYLTSSVTEDVFGNTTINPHATLTSSFLIVTPLLTTPANVSILVPETKLLNQVIPRSDNIQTSLLGLLRPQTAILQENAMDAALKSLILEQIPGTLIFEPLESTSIPDNAINYPSHTARSNYFPNITSTASVFLDPTFNSQQVETRESSFSSISKFLKHHLTTGPIKQEQPNVSTLLYSSNSTNVLKSSEFTQSGIIQPNISLFTTSSDLANNADDILLIPEIQETTPALSSLPNFETDNVLIFEPADNEMIIRDLEMSNFHQINIDDSTKAHTTSSELLRDIESSIVVRRGFEQSIQPTAVKGHSRLSLVRSEFKQSISSDVVNKTEQISDEMESVSISDSNVYSSSLTFNEISIHKVSNVTSLHTNLIKSEVVTLVDSVTNATATYISEEIPDLSTSLNSHIQQSQRLSYDQKRFENISDISNAVNITLLNELNENAFRNDIPVSVTEVYDHPINDALTNRFETSVAETSKYLFIFQTDEIIMPSSSNTIISSNSVRFETPFKTVLPGIIAESFDESSFNLEFGNTITATPITLRRHNTITTTSESTTFPKSDNIVTHTVIAEQDVNYVYLQKSLFISDDRLVSPIKASAVQESQSLAISLINVKLTLTDNYSPASTSV